MVMQQTVTESLANASVVHKVFQGPIVKNAIVSMKAIQRLPHVTVSFSPSFVDLYWINISFFRSYSSRLSLYDGSNQERNVLYQQN